MPTEHTDPDSKPSNTVGNLISNSNTSLHHTSNDQSFPILPLTSVTMSGLQSGTTIDNQFEGDAREVFNASLEYQNIQKPRSQEVDTLTSSSSLYPSIESVSEIGGDDADLERNWEAASKASSKKKSRESFNSQKETPASAIEYPQRLNAETEDGGVIPRISVVVGENDTVDAHATSQYPTVASMPSQREADEDTEAYLTNSGAARMPNMREFGNQDDDLIELKRAAYNGQPTDTTSTYVARMPYHGQAEATVIGYDVHPSEIAVGSVQAELLGQDFGASVSSIRSGPVENVIAEAWSAAPAAEATVLENLTSNRSSLELDRKPPAVDRPHSWTGISDEGEERMEILHRTSEEQEAQATVVDYELHHSEFSADAVQAEFVGEECNATMDFPQSTEENFPATESSRVTSMAQDVVEIDGNEIEEAMVIESGPMEKATAEIAVFFPVEEAQVMQGNTDTTMDEVDTKPPAIEDSQAWSTRESGRFAMADGEAEVVGISEEVHPSEFVGSTAAQAELIGPDFNTAIAIPSNEHEEASQVEGNDQLIEEATIVEEELSSSIIVSPGTRQTPSNEPQEAQATLIDESELAQTNSQRSPVGEQECEAIAMFEDRSVSNNAQPATPVTILEDSGTNDTTSAFYGVAVKSEPLPDPLTIGAATYLSNRMPTNTGEDDARDTPVVSRVASAALDEMNVPEWMAVPCLGVQNRDNLTTAMPPPSLAGRNDNTGIAGSSVPPVPSPTSFADNGTNTSMTSGRSDFSSSQSSGLHAISSNIARGTNNVMEKLFGNGKSQQPSMGFDLESLAGSVLPRTLLPSLVIYSETTKSWVTTVNTNQKALEANNIEESSKALHAFSVPTEKQALALASAWAPPKMHPFASNPTCFICETQFAVFRRANHCRNCGVCVCGPCSVQWPSKMLPATYNLKRASTVNICKACDWLCTAFRLTLLHGDQDKAVALYSTGNINLTTPFANVKGELFYPVHCAVLGGNLKLLKWLVDDHCCPLRSLRIGSEKVKNSSGSYTPILTSRGRSLLGIALSDRNVGIVRYLVVEKHMPLDAEKGLSVEILIQNLDLILRVLPEEVLDEQGLELETPHASTGLEGSALPSSSSTRITHNHLSTGGQEGEIPGFTTHRRNEDELSEASPHGECIICFSNDIDCVATPCGHQVCCLECSRHISRCPVCAVDCGFMRVFKP